MNKNIKHVVTNMCFIQGNEPEIPNTDLLKDVDITKDASTMATNIGEGTSEIRTKRSTPVEQANPVDPKFWDVLHSYWPVYEWFYWV